MLENHMVIGSYYKFCRRCGAEIDPRYGAHCCEECQDADDADIEEAMTHDRD